MTGDNVTSAASNYPTRIPGDHDSCHECGAKLDVDAEGGVSCPTCDVLDAETVLLAMDALAACGARGHHMGKWAEVEVNGRTLFRAACTSCGKEVDVELNPPANGIQIGGEAVALGCLDS